MRAGASGLLVLPALAACGGCPPYDVHARSGPAAVGVAVPDTCLRSPRNHPDFDGFFWNGKDDPSIASDGFGGCRTPSPGGTPTTGTFTLVDSTHMVFTGVDGRRFPFVRAGRTETEYCTD